ncbi:response regulator [Pantoea sp. A4]|uniref:response regulator n=1 Tax=Pantoea sp. A4 TaxID=1225184 RepID=UPI001ED9C4CC|nr:response regulator [Pantoea sp. A4]
MMHNTLILIVEDDHEIAAILTAYLQNAGYRTHHAENGALALEYCASSPPHLIILDVRMPVMDGWQVLAEVRRRGNTPVIMLTANDDDVDKLSALRIGADDYVVKPFNPAEVVARVQAVLRRSRAASFSEEILSTSSLSINLAQHSVIVKASSVDIAPRLTTTEFRLITQFVREPNRVFSREELLEACFPEGDTLPRTVDSHISKLRKKLEDAEATGLLQNVRGFGYRLGERK